LFDAGSFPPEKRIAIHAYHAAMADNQKTVLTLVAASWRQSAGADQ